MFKNLKEKVEKQVQEQAHRLQSAVSEAGENIATQVRNRATDGGWSERGSVTSNDALATHNQAHLPQQQQQQHNSVMGGSSIMDGFSIDDELDASPTRQRRMSTSSMASSTTDDRSPFDWQPITTRELQPIADDVESTFTELDSASTLAGAASTKEQISGVLRKLQGRAANYKDKYRDLAKDYNELVRDNDKCRKVLASTQDAALQRIEKLRNDRKSLRAQIDDLKSGGGAKEERTAKLETLLARCKATIKTNNEKIADITNENHRLKGVVEKADGEEGISALVSERLNSEWKSKLEASIEEWTKKCADADERCVMTVAQTKQGMHEQLEARDAQIATLMQQRRHIDTQFAEQTTSYEARLGEASTAASALEVEKTELFAQLSKVKTDAVAAVKSEEDLKRQKVEQQFGERVSQRDSDWQKKLDATIAKHNGDVDALKTEYERKLRDGDEQAQLAIEEREMQKGAALVEQDRRHDVQLADLSTLQTDNMQLKTHVERLKQEQTTMKADCDTQLESMRQQVTLAMDTSQSEERQIQRQLQEEKAARIVDGDARRAIDAELAALRTQFDSVQSAKTDAETTIANLEQKMGDAIAKHDADMERVSIESDELAKIRSESEACTTMRTDLATAEGRVVATEALVKERSQTIKTMQGDIDALTNDIQMMKESLGDVVDKRTAADRSIVEGEEKYAILQLKYEEALAGDADVAARYREQLDALKTENETLTTKSTQCVELGRRVDALEAELTTTRTESSEMQDVQQKRYDAEQKVLQTNEELASLTAELNGARASASEQESLAKRLQAELDDSVLEVEQLEAQMTSKESQLKENESACESQEVDIREMETSMAKLRGGRDEVQKECSQLRAQLDASNAALGEQSTQIEHMRANENTSANDAARIVELEERLAGVADELNKATASKTDTESSCSKLNVDIEQLNAQLAATVDQSSFDDVQRRLDDATTLANEHEATSKHARDAMAKMDKESQTKDERLSEFSRRVEESNAAMAKMQTEFDQQQQSSAGYASEKGELETAVDNFRAKLEDGEANVFKLENALSDALAQCSKLETNDTQRREEQQSKLAELTNLVDELRTTGDSSAEEVRRLTSEVEGRDRRLGEVEERASNVETEADAKVATYKKKAQSKLVQIKTEYESQKDGLNTKIADLEQQLTAATASGESEEAASTLRSDISAKATRITELERMVDEHDAKVIKLGKSLDAQMCEKEAVWASELADRSATQQSDADRLGADYQREVRQLYKELNDKSEAMNDVERTLRRQLDEQGDEIVQLNGRLADAAKSDATATMNSLQITIDELRRELSDKEQKHKRELELLTTAAMTSAKSDAAPITKTVVNGSSSANRNRLQSVDLDSASTDYVETEYLRNVLYRYMVDREALGAQGAISTARVVAQALKFPGDKVAEIVAKEEKRHSSTLGAYLPHALQP